MDCLLKSWPIENDGEEQVVWQTLHDLLMAWSRFEMMSGEHRALTTALCKKLQHHFDTKCTLKERKTKRKKENFPPNPLIKEKQKKEKRKSKRESVCDAESDSGDDFKKRREAFHQACLAYVDKYPINRLAAFYRHYSQKSVSSDKMMFEEEKYWTLENRLELWMGNQHSADIAAAAERLKKARGKQQKEQTEAEQQQVQAAQREAENSRLEEQIKANKAGAVTSDEQIAKNPNGVLAQIKREREARERATKLNET